MKHIIGHRGAAGLALENSAAALKIAIKLRVPELEIDVRRTKDDRLVLSHDPDLRRLGGNPSVIAACTWDELREIPLRDGSHLLLLDDALQLLGDQPVNIEVKDHGSEEVLLTIFDRFPGAQITVVSFKHDVLASLRRLRPGLPLSALTFLRPLSTLKRAQELSLQGFGVSLWGLSPWVYRRALLAGLDVYVYTINSPRLASLLWRIYPGLVICTDHPDRFI